MGRVAGGAGRAVTRGTGALRVLHVERERYAAESRALLEQHAVVDYADCETQAELGARLRARSYDALFVRLGLSVGVAELEAAPSLSWVATPTTGHDHVDVDALRARGVYLVSLRGETEFLARVPSTAEHTWALLLALVRQVPGMHQQVLEGSWARTRVLGELSGKTLGVIGYGRLGRIVSRYAAAFGMRVLATDHDAAAVPPDHLHVTPVPLARLLGESDVVSLHLLLTPETEGFLDAERLAAMKPGAYLVNTARGELLDEAALLQGLESGHLAGAALDVLRGDSSWQGRSPEGHPLVAYARCHDNLLLSPHVGGYGAGSILATRQFLVEKFLDAVARRAKETRSHSI